jgi:hypothetical protein
MRSPNYPQLSLPEAINKAQEVYAAIHTAKASPIKIAEKLGYSSLNGRSMGVLSALKKYGLLAGKGNELGVTHDAVIIFERPDDHPEKREAIRNAALSVPLFAELYERFGRQIQDQPGLRLHLTKLGFSRVAMDEIVANYLDTVRLVTPPPDDYTALVPSFTKEGESAMQSSSPSIQQGSETPTAPPATLSQPKPTSSEDMKAWSFPLSIQRNIDAVITIHGGKLKKRDLEVLGRKVRDLIDAWEEDEESDSDA